MTARTSRSMKTRLTWQTLMLCMVVIPLAITPIRASDVDPLFEDGVIPILAVHTFQPSERGNLYLDDRGRARLAAPVVHATGDNAHRSWYEPGWQAEPHPILEGKARYQRFKEILIDLYAGTADPAARDILGAAEQLLKGIDGDTPLTNVALLLAERAVMWGPDVAAALSPVTRAIRSVPETAPAGPSLENGTLLVWLVETLHLVRSEQRMEIVRSLVAGSPAGMDPTFERARLAAEESIERRRSRRQLVLRDHLRSYVDDPDPETLARFPVPVLPFPLVRALPLDLSSEAVEALGYEYPLDTTDEDAGGFFELESDLILCATLSEGLFGGQLPEPDCSPVSEADRFLVRGRPLEVQEADAGHLCTYMAWMYYDTLVTLLGHFDDTFVARAFDWELTEIVPGVRTGSALKGWAAIRRRALTKRLRTCEP